MRRTVLVVLLFVAPSVFGQSVADAARQNRPKDTKVTTQRVFTDDDFEHSTVANTPEPAKSPTATVEDGQRKAKSAVDDLDKMTPRELSDSVVRDIQFPDRPQWEEKLYAEKQILVGKARALLATVDANAAQGIKDSALASFQVEALSFNRLKAEGIGKAAEWERRR